MTVSLRVTAKVDAMLRDLSVVQRRVAPAAVVQSLNRTAERAIEGPSVRDVARAAGVQPSRVRWRYDNRAQRTGRRRFSKRPATRRDQRVSFWFRPTYIPASALGKLPAPDPARRRKRTRSGPLTVGGKAFPGAFVQAPRGNRQAFRRDGAARYPISLARIELEPQAGQIIGGHVRASGGRFVREFERAMKAQLARQRGRR